MAGIKSLVKDTAVYGISSIVGRFLNWLLVPLYTVMFAVEEYGVVTYVYSVVAVVMVVLIYGLETGFFRFANHERWKDATEVYSTCLISLAVSSSVFFIGVLAALGPVTHWMRCDGHPEYVAIMALCVAIDAFLAIPYCYLRYRRRPFRFVTLKLVNIGLNIGLNLFFILLCPWLMAHAPATVGWFYRPDFGIGYIFLANLLASAVNLAMMLPELRGFRYRFNGALWKEIMVYSLPLLVLGVAGIMNQTIDKILYPMLVSDPAEAMYGLGIYGANYKIAVVLLVFLQAFRFAYEPFIFARARDDGESRLQSYRDAMKYFIIFALLIFLGVMFYLDFIRYFISPRYFSGLKVVPIVMLAELFFGIFFNLSLWYKLTDRTSYGAWFSLLGCAVTVTLNIVLVPRIAYMGCAIAALASYGTMMAVSYLTGNKKYPVGYPLGRIALYFAVAAALYGAGVWLLPLSGMGEAPMSVVRLLLLGLYVGIVMLVEHLGIADLLGPLAAKLHRR
ncbi:MAG: polysaccharide biosynthesis C-terminal domain-containing protein [Muribaculaceae bacterium]|nr:polysaccharide biosynthesis C-terminal domain-containing protein [Muribaculaceae bacterium]